MFTLKNLAGRTDQDFINKFSTIPKDCTELSLWKNKLNQRSREAWVKSFTKIPNTVAYLGLSRNDFGTIAANSLKEFFSVIPKTVTKLDLSNNNLGNLGGELWKAVQAIPESVTELNLNHNDLGSLTKEELIKVWKALPKNLQKLSLYNNSFGNSKTLSSDDLITVFPTIPKNIKTLILSGNQLSQFRSSATLQVLFEFFPESVTSLELDDFELDKINGSSLASVLSIMPASITSLSFHTSGIDKFAFFQGKIPEILKPDSHNSSIDKVAGDELAKAFAAITASVNTVSLTIDNLTDITGDELATAIKALPKSVTSLNLYSDTESRLKKNALAKILAATPGHITSLHWGYNRHDLLDADDLEQALKVIPNTVTSLDLSNFGFGNPEHKGKLKQVLRAVPGSITSLDLSHNDFEEKNADELADAFQSMSKKVTSLKLTLNFFDFKNGARLGKILAAIPESVTHLDFDYTTNLFRIDSISGDEEVMLAFANIPKGVRSINLEGNNFDKIPANRLNKILSALPEHVKTVELNDKKKIDLPVPDFKEDKNDPMEKIKHQLRLLKQKKDSFKNTAQQNKSNRYIDAAKASKSFYKFMEQLYKDYNQSEITLDEFKLFASYALGNEKPLISYQKNNEEWRRIYEENEYPYHRYDIERLKYQQEYVATLKTHREYKEIIINLLAAFLSLIIPYAAASLYSKATTGHWTVFKPETKAGKIVNDMEKSLDEMYRCSR